jgi:hypothetical protein
MKACIRALHESRPLHESMYPSFTRKLTFTRKHVSDLLHESKYTGMRDLHASVNTRRDYHDFLIEQALRSLSRKYCPPAR